MTKRQFVEQKVAQYIGGNNHEAMIQLVLDAENGIETILGNELEARREERQAERERKLREVREIEAELARPIEAVFIEEPVAEAVDNPKVAEEQVL